MQGVARPASRGDNSSAFERETELDCCIVIHEGKTDELRVEGQRASGVVKSRPLKKYVLSGFLVCRMPAAFSPAFHLVLLFGSRLWAGENTGTGTSFIMYLNYR
jgi:hypothetical protein